MNTAFSLNLIALYISYFRLKADILGDIVCGIWHFVKNDG